MESREIKEKLLWAVGEIMEAEGHCRISESYVAEKAGVGVEEINKLFGDLENLLELYILKEDYWIKLVKPVNRAISGVGDLKLESVINFFLSKQYETISESAAMRNLIRWSISEYHPLMGKIGMEREEAGEDFFLQTDTIFQGTGINFRAVSAINVAAIYYLSMYGSTGNGNFCGIDLSTDEGRKQILEAVHQINAWAFESKGRP